MTRSQRDLTNTKLHDQDDRKPKGEKKITKKGTTIPQKAAKKGTERGRLLHLTEQ
jgi:hypothetical protein